MAPVGRNSLCPCNSGKKYKACCQDKDAEEEKLARDYSSIYQDQDWLKLRKAQGDIELIFDRYVEVEFEASIYDVAWDEFKLFGLGMGDRKAYEPYFKSWMYYSWSIDSEFLPGEEPVTIAQLCLEEHSEFFTQYQKRLIRAVDTSPFSFFMIEDVIPASRLFLKDILLQTKIEVKECNGSKGAGKGGILFCRPVTLDGQSIIIGMAQYRLPNRCFEEFIEYRKWLLESNEVSRLTPELLLDYEPEMRELYFSLLDQASQPMRFANTDGDPIVLNEIFYQLKCTPKEAFDALVVVSPKSHNNQWKESDEVNIVWGTDERSSSLGNFTITPTELKVFVNSNERALQVKEVIQHCLGAKVSFIKEKSTPMSGSDDLPKQKKNQTLSSTSYTLEETRVVKEYMANHWIKWLDMNIPALGNVTPRQAAQSEMGREKLEALFLDFDNKNKTLFTGNKEYQRVDLEFLRKELGMLS